MANDEQVALLQKGALDWNEWRRLNFGIRPNLYKAPLREAALNEVDLSLADLREADLNRAVLREADLNRADLSGTDLSGADLSNCIIYGVTAWNSVLKDAIQNNLIITRSHEPTITVDDLEIAQSIFLLLNNQKLWHLAETITSKAVLILGRFTGERKKVLDAIREGLRQRGYIPIHFDFDPPADRDLTQKVPLLARVSRFIIIDHSDPLNIFQVLNAIVPDLPTVPVQPLIMSSQREFEIFKPFERYSWVLPIHKYEQADDLLGAFSEKVIQPAEAKANELRKR